LTAGGRQSLAAKTAQQRRSGRQQRQERRGAQPVSTLYTIGHSTRTFEEFLEVLRAQAIQTVVDIRSFPMSRRLPHFNRESLLTALPDAGIAYIWNQDLGGRRKKIRDDSPHLAIRSPSFRNYADYMLTPQFEDAIAALLKLADQSRTACMCAEKLYFNCHRMMVSDWLVAHGHAILHLDGTGPAKPHQPMAEARMIDGQLIYRGDRLL
jgi:uncharacterized protein (DUF488 family)